MFDANNIKFNNSGRPLEVIAYSNDGKILSKKVKNYDTKGNVTGVIGSKPPHKMKAAELKKIIEFEDMFIDIGASSKEEALKRVNIGDPIIIKQAGRTLRNITEGAIGSLVATAVQPAVWHSISQAMAMLFPK